MVRTTTEADDESTTTESYDAPADVTVGDVIDVSGASFLPKSNLEVVSVDPDWAADRYPDARVFAAKIPNRSNAREYTFKVSEYGTVTTTNSNGTFGLGVTVDVVEVGGDLEDAPDGDGRTFFEKVVDLSEGDTVDLMGESLVVTHVRHSAASITVSVHGAHEDPADVRPRYDLVADARYDDVDVRSTDRTDTHDD